MFVVVSCCCMYAMAQRFPTMARSLQPQEGSCSLPSRASTLRACKAINAVVFIVDAPSACCLFRLGKAARFLQARQRCSVGPAFAMAVYCSRSCSLCCPLSTMLLGLSALCYHLWAIVLVCVEIVSRGGAVKRRTRRVTGCVIVVARVFMLGVSVAG